MCCVMDYILAAISMPFGLTYPTLAWNFFSTVPLDLKLFEEYYQLCFAALVLEVSYEMLTTSALVLNCHLHPTKQI